MKKISTAIAFIKNKEGKFLTLKRAPDKKFHPNVWDVIAGKIELNEDPEIAIRREISEETQLDNLENLRLIVNYQTTDEANEMELNAYLYVCSVSTDTIEMNQEHTEYKWVTLDEFLALDHNYLVDEDLKYIKDEL